MPVSQPGVTGLQNPADVFAAEGDELEMPVTEVDAGNRRIVTRAQVQGGEPIFHTAGAAGDAPDGEASPEE